MTREQKKVDGTRVNGKRAQQVEEIIPVRTAPSSKNRKVGIESPCATVYVLGSVICLLLSIIVILLQR